MAGVTVHAQMVSQMLNITLNQRTLTWALPEWMELIWIGGWAIAGGSLVWFVRHPLLLSLGAVVVLTTLAGTTLVIFIAYNGWIPSVTPAVALILTGATVMSWRSYQLPS